jgi:hypothetical protein
LKLIFLQALTIALKPVPSCTSSSTLAQNERYYNKLLNGGGCYKNGGVLICPYAGTQKHPDEYTISRCQKVQADYVFGYLAFAFGAASIIITFLTHRGSGRATATYV